KSFNVDVFPHGRSHYRMTFFVPVPGLRLDHYRVAFDELYAADEMVDLDMPGLIEGLESLPCCVTDKKGEHYGDPLNIAFVADIEDLYYAFLRAGWDETETIHRVSVWKTIRSAVSGANYRYSPVSPLYVFGRGQDAALQRARDSIHERNHLRIWLTPMRYEGTPVWIGQISRDIGVRLSAKTIFTHKIDPVVDETREFLIEDLAYTQSLEKFGYVQGVGAAPYELPRRNLTGDPYITDGLRAVMWVSDAVVSLDSLELLDLGAHPSTALPTAVPE
ncbi:MAG TPA: LssY C-terminal domain-containing protein, partial [Rhodothermales bacterium]